MTLRINPPLLINHPETKFPIAVLCSHCYTSFPLGDCDDVEYKHLLERARTCCLCDVKECPSAISNRWSMYCTQHMEERQALDAARRAEQDKLDEIEEARIAALTPVELDREQTIQLLRDTMSECQEEISCSSWEDNTEYLPFRPNG